MKCTPSLLHRRQNLQWLQSGGSAHCSAERIQTLETKSTRLHLAVSGTLLLLSANAVPVLAERGLCASEEDQIPLEREYLPRRRCVIQMDVEVKCNRTDGCPGEAKGSSPTKTLPDTALQYVQAFYVLTRPNVLAFCLVPHNKQKTCMYTIQS